MKDTEKYDGKYYKYKMFRHTHSHSYLLPKILDLLKSHKKDMGQKCRLLDIGSGNGSLCHLLSSQGFDCTGIEASESGVKLARKNAPEATFYNRSVYEPLQEELFSSFDIILSMEVIEHLQYPRALVRLSKEYLKKGGTLILTTPYHSYIKNLLISVLNKWDRHANPLKDNGHVRFFSVKTLTQLMREEGFKVNSFHFAGRFPFLWKSMIVVAQNDE